MQCACVWVCVLVGFCFYFLDHPSESEVALALPHWLIYLSVAWKFWGSVWHCGVLRAGACLQLDPQGIKSREQCAPPLCSAQCMGRGGRLLLRRKHPWPWPPRPGRPQNSTLVSGTNDGLSHESQTASFQMLSLLLSGSVTWGHWLVWSGWLLTHIDVWVFTFRG